MPDSAGCLQILKGELQAHFLEKRALILKVVFWCFGGEGELGRGWLIGLGIFFSLYLEKLLHCLKLKIKTSSRGTCGG